MTDLTEQWKKGELPKGHYYVKDGENMIAEYLDGYFYNNGEPMTSFTGGVDKVLALVPSYDEWFQIKNLSSLTSLLQEKNIECLHRENKLKELLKECKNILEEQTFCRNTSLQTDETLRNRIVKKAEILQKIDEALK